jgi:hypothetical protein
MILKSMVVAAALVLTAVAIPASAQDQEGLVNVNISDNNTTVQVPVAVAAQVCGVTVDVINSKPKNEAVCSITQEQATAAGIKS